MEENKKKNKWIIWVILGVVLFYVAIFALFICLFIFGINSELGHSEINYVNNSILIGDEELIIKNDITGNFINESYVIEGYLTNISDYDMNYITLNFNVLDKDGVIIGSTFAYVESLKVDETWRFKAVYTDFDYLDAYTFELSSVDYY